jgi:hypothetical protein
LAVPASIRFARRLLDDDFDATVRYCEAGARALLGASTTRFDVFPWLPLARQFGHSQRFCGLVAALKLAKHGDILMAMLLTASSEIAEGCSRDRTFLVVVDRETSVRWGWIGSIQ